MGWLSKLFGEPDYPPDTAATLIAATIDLDDNCSQWVLTGHDQTCASPRLTNDALRVSVHIGYVRKNAHLTIDGKNVPLSFLEGLALESAMMRWRQRQDEMTRQAVLETSARRVRDYVRDHTSQGEA